MSGSFVPGLMPARCVMRDTRLAWNLVCEDSKGCWFRVQTPTQRLSPVFIGRLQLVDGDMRLPVRSKTQVTASHHSDEAYVQTPSPINWDVVGLYSSFAVMQDNVAVAIGAPRAGASAGAGAGAAGLAAVGRSTVWDEEVPGATLVFSEEGAHSLDVLFYGKEGEVVASFNETISVRGEPGGELGPLRQMTPTSTASRSSAYVKCVLPMRGAWQRRSRLSAVWSSTRSRSSLSSRDQREWWWIGR